MSSSSESEEEEIPTKNTRRVGNSFAGLNLDSDSSSEEEDSSDAADAGGKEQVISVPLSEEKGENEDSDDGDDDDDDSLTDEHDVDDDPEDASTMSDFSHLVARTTRHGTATIQADFVEAIKDMVGDGGKPTEIQRDCWTTMLSPLTQDRDIVAVSKTGSGKTLAFLVPLLASLTTAAEPIHDASFIYPRAIILAPTRVLAQQIYDVASTLVTNTPSLNVRVSVVLGGAAYHHQMAHLLASNPDLIIATPGRLNSLCGQVAATAQDDEEVEMCIKLDEVCEVVVDEADMMLALGFQEALSWFAQLVNEKSALGFRLVLTSATWDEETSANLSKFESISSDQQQDPVLLTADGAGQVVSKNVTQRVEVIASKGAPRFNYLVKLLTKALLQGGDDSSNRVIVFCLFKSQARQMGKDLRAKAGIENVVMEGDMSQSARMAAMDAFQNGTSHRVLVATDVAARGLNVLSVSHVFNYSLGISIESYIHKCGRTGRAGQFGVAHTFVLKGSDEKLTPELCTVLQKANQAIPDDLRIMAAKETKRRTRGATIKHKSSSLLEKEEEIREAREENRKKQILLNQQRSKKSGNNANKRRGRK